MGSSSEPADLVRTAFRTLPPQDILRQPVTVLLGVSTPAADGLAGIGVETVFDLALARVFAAAVQLTTTTSDPTSAMSRFGSPPAGLVRDDVLGTTPLAELRYEPVDVLAGVPGTLAAALDVTTVRDLALYPPFLAATALLRAAYFPEQAATVDPEAPGDLLPVSGAFPTERVQYTTLVLDHLLRPDGAPPLVDVGSSDFQPIDIAPVAAPDFGFTTLGLGALLTLNQSWFMQGVTLGHLLHSMALAPGESTRIAVVDWSRRTSAGQTESVGESEDLSQEVSRNRSISEVTEAVAREAQEGFSETNSTSTTKQAGASGGLSIGPVGFGASASIAKTTASADSYSTTSGSREVGSSMLQQAADRTQQHAHSARTRRASVVREVSQSEHEQVSTRVVANYNHMHALTVQYYEVLQVYRTQTQLTNCERVVFVPFKLVDFSNDSLLRRFRSTLVDVALTPAVRDALVNYDTLEIVPERRVSFPDIGGTIDEAVIGGMTMRRVALARRAPTGEPGEDLPTATDAPPTPDRPPRPLPEEGQVTRLLWAGAGRRLSSILGTGSMRRGSESLFVPSDVRVVDGMVSSPAGDAISLAYQRADGSTVTDLSLSVPLAEIARISLSGSSQTSAVEATATLTLARNGVLFPLELPTVTVERGSTSTPLIRLQGASADVNLVDHLTSNALHYSQAVFRTLDAAMLAGLLSPYSISIDGETVPLVQVAEPRPLRIVGNALAFKIATDTTNDTEWAQFMLERGLTIGETKEDLVPLSSGGVFAEAVLGRYNSAEKLDLTRFWNWQESPIPLQPSDIAAIQTGSRQSAEDLKAGGFSQPLVAITQPPALPDPTGTAGVLAAIQNGAMFRDMSGLAETVKLATESVKASSSGATAAGTQATKAMEVAVTADTERRKIAASKAVEEKKIAASLAASLAGKPLSEQSDGVKGGAINEVAKKAKEAAAGTPGATAGGGPGSGPGGTGTGGATAPRPGGGSAGGGVAAGSAATGASRPGAGLPASTGNIALDAIVGNEALLRDFIGMADESPVPTPPVTLEGVPLQEWDLFGVGYSLLYDPIGAAGPDVPSETQLEQVVTAKRWKPTTPTDFRPLLLGDLQRGVSSLGDVLFAVSLLPTGSLRTLNLVAHATGGILLSFGATFVFDEATRETTTVHEDDAPDALSRVDLTELLALGQQQDVTRPDGSTFRLEDVRRAFPADGEVNVFNLSNPLRHDYVQGLATLFGVRTTAFVEQPVKVTAEVIAVTDPASERVLSKKVTIGFIGEQDAVPPVDAFSHLLLLDRSLTGSFTAFPRR
ncbi:hypothetical protein [Oryzobacter terrae]|uniref:hypothetical protein n=1 Tax=Oryzobacter terrae TaxID=1620385 RepID=UPI00366EBD3E